MEIKAYLEVVKQRWKLAIIPTILILILGIITYRSPQSNYSVEIKYLIGQAPLKADLQSEEMRYFNWVTSEYIVHGINDWANGTTFAQEISNEIATQGFEVDPETISNAIRGEVVRSRLTLYMSHGDKEEFEAIVASMLRILRDENIRYVPQLGGDPAKLILLDNPTIEEQPGAILSQVDILLRLIAAVGVGIGVMLVAEYLDPMVRTKNDLVGLNLPILGEIPKG
jgi:capsular polysaccharide biosynthesis protein